jgi:uncharacterized phage protein (TIGR02218 family)
MPAWIEGELTSATFLWTLERRDGVALGFTTHDRDLEVNGLTYKSAPGMLPSSIERNAGLDPDDLELAGALTSDAITEDDLLAGRWDGASLRLEMADWENPNADRIVIARGTLGSVEIADGRFSVVLRGPTAQFETPVTIETTPDCRAGLGDAQCGVDMAGRRTFVRVTSSAANLVLMDQTSPDGFYAFGLLRWVSGQNSGLESRILGSAGNQLTLDEPPHFPITPGDLAEAIQGCDKRFVTCISRFGNAANFRGEPHLPGNDLLTRYAS